MKLARQWFREAKTAKRDGFTSNPDFRPETRRQMTEFNKNLRHLKKAFRVILTLVVLMLAGCSKEPEGTFEISNHGGSEFTHWTNNVGTNFVRLPDDSPYYKHITNNIYALVSDYDIGPAVPPRSYTVDWDIGTKRPMNIYLRDMTFIHLTKSTGKPTREFTNLAEIVTWKKFAR